MASIFELSVIHRRSCMKSENKMSIFLLLKIMPRFCFFLNAPINSHAAFQYCRRIMNLRFCLDQSSIERSTSLLYFEILQPVDCLQEIQFRVFILTVTKTSITKTY